MQDSAATTAERPAERRAGPGDGWRRRSFAVWSAGFCLLALVLAFGPRRDFVLDIAATLAFSVSLLFLGGWVAGRSRTAAIAAQVAAVCLAAATLWVGVQAPDRSLLTRDSSSDIGLSLYLVEQRSLIRTDRTVEMYAADDNFARIWAVWRRAGGDAPTATAEDRTITIVDAGGRTYRTVVDAEFKPEEQFCLRVLRCGEVDGARQSG